MRVPLLDLKAQLPQYRTEVLEALTGVVDAQAFILGAGVAGLEQELAERCGVTWAVGVSSGSDALLVSLMALGVEPGDEVVTTPFTFFATAGAIARLGARPVFADIDPETFNLDSAQVASVLSRRTKAVIPVHLFGQLAELDLYDLPREDRPAIVEDAAQALDARLGAHGIGQLGDAACVSFFPSKNLGAFGDGGLVVGQDEELGRRIRILRAHGSSPKYHHPLLGGNFRLDALQAAVLRVKLPLLAGWNAARRNNAERYAELFEAAGLPARGCVRLPVVRPAAEHVFHQYTVRAERRDELQAHLKAAGVGSAVYYPTPLHLQPCFAGLGYARGDFPEAELACTEVLSLPIYGELSAEQQGYVVDQVAAFYGV